VDPAVPLPVGALDVTEPPRLCAGVLVLVLVGDVVVPVGVGDGDTDGDELGVTDGVGVSEGKMSIGRMSSANAAGAKAPITSIVQATNTTTWIDAGASPSPMRFPLGPSSIATRVTDQERVRRPVIRCRPEPVRPNHRAGGRG
jgi:hypothetical protein